MGDHHARQGDDRNLGGATTDVADRVAARLGDRQARADGGREGLVDEPPLPRTRGYRGLRHRAPLDRGHARRDADHDLGLEDPLAALHLADEVVEHALGDHEVRDDTLAHRPHDLDRVGRAPDHLLRGAADGQDASAVAVDGDEGGLVDDNPLPLDVNQDSRRTKVNPDLLGKKVQRSMPLPTEWGGWVGAINYSYVPVPPLAS